MTADTATMPACGGPGRHTMACYAREVLPCPSCGAPVGQTVTTCSRLEPWPPLQCTGCSLACPDCQSEVRITEGKKIYARVVHSGTCPWHARYLRREAASRIPCGVTVTHRGPYKRDPESGR